MADQDFAQIWSRCISLLSVVFLSFSVFVFVWLPPLVGGAATARRDIVPHHNVGQVWHIQRAQHVLRIPIDLNLRNVDDGNLRHEVHPTLTLLLLQLQGDAPNRPPRNPLHQLLLNKNPRRCQRSVNYVLLPLNGFFLAR